MLLHLRPLSEAVDLPINADSESGFAADPDGVATNVALAIQTGVAGLSIEDRKVEAPFGLYDKTLAIQRIRAARTSIDQSGSNMVLVARTEGLLNDPGAITPAIDKLVAFAEAGADCLYAPGVQKKGDIAAMVRAVAPKPVNVLVMGPGFTVAELADLGVRRISVGDAPSQVSWAAVLSAAEKMKAGFFDGLALGTPGRVLNDNFSKFAEKNHGP